MATQQDVEFKTIDGLTLRGRVLIAKEAGHRDVSRGKQILLPARAERTH